MRIGDWTIIPSQNVIERDGVAVKIEPRAMDLLVYLARAGSRVVSPDELLRDVWHGRVFDDGVVHKKINQLRKALGDDSQQPRFIATIPKRGYRLVAPVVLEAAASERHEHGTAAVETGSREPVSVAATNEAPSGRRLVALGAAAAVLVIVAGGAWFDADTPVVEERLEFTPVSFQRDGSEILHAVGSTVWSPDGKAIAFAAGRGDVPGPPQVYLRYFDSPQARLLADEGLPKAWTPNGRILINTSRGPFSTSESAGLLTVPSVGGQVEPFFSVPEGTTNLMDVSRDGATIAALRRGEDGVWGIWSAALPDGTLERYEPAPFAAAAFLNVPALSFSPDGRQLLLMWNEAGEGEQAWLMPYPADPARPPQRVLEGLPQFATPTFSWLPDNRHIVVSTRARDRPLRLYLADTVSGRFRPFADGPSTAQQIAPLVSPDGTRLLFAELSFNLDVVTLDLRTLAVTPLVATNGVEQMPAWGAGTDAFVYVVDRDGETEIWLRTAAGEARPVVTARDFEPGATGYLMAPQLSPDGGRVAYSRAERDGRGGTTVRKVWISSLAGGSMRLTESSFFETAGAWSPDGNWYVYSEAPSGGPIRLKKAPTSGRSEPVTLVSAAGLSRILPVWSPDGRWILYDDEGLKLISADGELVREFEMKGTLCAFARDEPLLYCIRNVFSAPVLTVVGLDGSVQEIGPVAVTNAPVNNAGPSLRISLTPNGQGVTYSVDRTRRQLVLVDGLASVARP